jgi:preprotein translocase subunit SecD
MGGREGSPYPWCAGFASTVVRQAAESLGVAPPFALSVGCDEIIKEPAQITAQARAVIMAKVTKPVL